MNRKPRTNSSGALQLRPAAPEGRDPGEYLDAGRNGDRHACGREEAERELRYAGGEHVMHPQPEAQEPGAHERRHDEAIADQRRLRQCGHDHGDHSRGRQEDDVDLGMPEEPEQVLPQKRVAGLFRNEEGPVKGPLQLEQDRRRDDGWKRHHDHPGKHQHRPAIHWHLVERHAGRAGPQHAHDDLDRSRDGRDLDEADPQKPEVRVDAGRVSIARERRIHEPSAVRRQAEEQAAEEGDAADEISPERVCAQPRKRQVPRGEHVGQQEYAHRLDRRHGEQEHHHRAVHREDLIVERVPDQGVLRHGQLRAHQQTQHAGQDEKEEGRPDVEKSDIGVVDDGQEVHAGRRPPHLLELRQLARWSRQRIGKRHASGSGGHVRHFV